MKFLADSLGELAMGYGLVWDYGQAALLFDEACLEPGSPTLLLNYARTALMLGDPARANTLATESIQRYPGDCEQLAQAHQVLGRALLKLNRTQEARKELEAAVALDPDLPQRPADLAVACLDLDDEKCAVQIFSEMEKSFADTAEIHMAFGRAYGDSDFQPRAVTEFRRAIEENPHLPGAHYLLASVLLATGDDQSHLDGAELELKKELDISPRDSMTYAALAKLR